MFANRLLFPLLLTVAAPIAFLLLCANLLAGEPCGKVCQATIEEVTEEKTQWEVGCKEICVPRVVCPWAPGGTGITTFNFMKNTVSSGGCNEPECFENLPTDCVYCEAPRCGDVRSIHTLDKKQCETRTSVAKWDLENNCCRYGPACCTPAPGGCACPTCEGQETMEPANYLTVQDEPAGQPAPKEAKKSFWQFWK